MLLIFMALSIMRHIYQMGLQLWIPSGNMLKSIQYSRFENYLLINLLLYYCLVICFVLLIKSYFGFPLLLLNIS